MNDDLQYSSAGEAVIESFEGYSNTAYKDVGGVWTIGYGHTQDVKPGDVCTDDQAQQWLTQDIQWAVSEVKRVVTVPLTQNEFDALVDFVYNVGIGNFESSTMLKLLNSGNYADAAGEFAKWDIASGKQIAGLLNRRIAERDEFLK
jgi:lysozyme